MEKTNVTFANQSYKTFKQFADTIVSGVVFILFSVWYFTTTNHVAIKEAFNYNVLNLKFNVFFNIFTINLVLALVFTKIVQYVVNKYLDSNKEKIEIVKHFHDNGEYAATMNFLKFGITLMALIVVTILCAIRLDFVTLILVIWCVFIVSNLSMEATILREALKEHNDKPDDNEDEDK